jgi:hypothetical protein
MAAARAAPSPYPGLPVVRCSGRGHNGQVRVVATRIEQDGTMLRRVVDTARCSDGPRWEDLAGRALAAPPPYRPVSGAPVYHVSLDGGGQVLVAERDLGGALLDLVTAVLGMGEEVERARPAARGFAGRLAPAVTGAPGLPGWRDLELGAPAIARLGMTRLTCPRVALLGTLRRDASPRISPVEPCVADGQLLIGAMAWSRKAADLRRDPRYVLHSMVTGADTEEGELKLHGSAVPAGPRELTGADPAWWSGQAPERAAVFTLRIATAIFVEWGLEQAMMTVHRWAPQDGYRRGARRYP